MASFTRIAEEETPSIEINVNRRVAKIDPNIYGGFTEHMGRCIYGGIYDPGSSLSDSNGYRMDVMEVLRDINIPVIRYPGGNFVATYHWQDGIGPRDQRPKRPELAWLGVETNQFGTDEFMHWLKQLGPDVEPYLCFNFGTGTLDEALAWVEYCNGTKDTYYANLRRKHGREEPYNIKYWALGNEMWGPWQVGQMTSEDYAKQAAQWAKALKLLDPSLILILCGETGHASWDHAVLKACIPYIDMHSIHIYTAAKEHLPNVTAPLSAERAIQTCAALIDIARIENNIPPTVPPTRICFDEWNVWDPTRAPGEQGGEESYTLSDALAVGVWLNVFVRQARYMGMANIAQTVNVISPLMTTKTGIIKQTTWWPLLLFSKYMRGWTISSHVSSGSYNGPTEPAWLRGVLEEGAAWLDVSATINEAGEVSVAVININPDKAFATSFSGAETAVGGKVDVYTVNGQSLDVVNTEDKQEVGIEESSWDGKGEFTFPKHSFTMLRWKTGKPVKEVKKEEYGRLDTRKLAWAGEGTGAEKDA